MRTQTKAAALALLLLGMTVPALGYHIDNATSSGTPGEPKSGDFVLGVPGLIACEVEWGASHFDGNVTHAADDRNALASDTDSLPGIGGLCTSGRNDATGTHAPSSIPAAGDWTRFDLCDATSHARNGAYGPYNPGNACAPTGSTGTWAYTARVGAFQCFIPIAGSTTVSLDPDHPQTWLAASDYALFYEERYAWWTYDGDGAYTGTEAANTLHGGDGSTSQVVDLETAWHGHVAAFIDVEQSDENAVATGLGSAETTAMTAPFSSHLPATSTVPLSTAEYPTHCDGSTGLDSAGNPQGPVFRAHYS